MKSEKTYYSHFDIGGTNLDKPGHLTVPLKLQNDDEIVCGWSWCHPNDMFKKRTGRENSVEKMTSKNALVVKIPLKMKKQIKDKKANIYEISKSLAEILLTVFFTPPWASVENVYLRNRNESLTKWSWNY